MTLYVRVREVTEIKDPAFTTSAFYMRFGESCQKKFYETKQCTGKHLVFKDEIIHFNITNMNSIFIAQLLSVQKTNKETVAQITFPMRLIPVNKRMMVKVAFPLCKIKHQISIALELNYMTVSGKPFTQPLENVNQDEFIKGLMESMSGRKPRTQ